MSLIAKLLNLAETHLSMSIFPTILGEPFVISMIKMAFDAETSSTWRETTLKLLTTYSVEIKTDTDAFFDAFLPILNEVLGPSKP